MSRQDRDRRYREKHAEKVKARNAAWRAKRKEHLKVRGAKRRLAKRAMCLVAAARVRSRRKGIAFDLDQHIEAIQARIDAGQCELSGVPFDLSPGRSFASPSLDRRDPELGYIYENVRVVCHAMNVALGDWGDEQLAEIMKCFLSRRGR